jgi:hypothetical protein
MTSAPPCAAVSPPRMRERRPRCGSSECARCAASTGQRALRRRRLESRWPSFRRCSAYGDRLGRRRARRICVASRRVGGRCGGGSAERRGCVGCNMHDDSVTFRLCHRKRRPAVHGGLRGWSARSRPAARLDRRPRLTSACWEAGRPAPPPSAGPTAAKRRLRAASDAPRPRHESARMNAMRAQLTLRRRLRKGHRLLGSSGCPPPPTPTPRRARIHCRAPAVTSTTAADAARAAAARRRCLTSADAAATTAAASDAAPRSATARSRDVTALPHVSVCGAAATARAAGTPA